MSAGPWVAQIERIRDLTPEVRELTLRLIDPSKFHFAPGQSVSFSIPTNEEAQFAIRYYSLASPPSQPDKLVLLLSNADRGTSPNYLFTRKEGEEVQFEGPDGSFCLHEDRKRHILFVATGTGIAPCRSMLFTLFEQSFDKKITLFWGLRRESDVFYHQELEDLASRYPNFSFVIVLSQSQATWSGAKGRVTQLVEQIPSMEKLAVYVCGNKTMVSEVTHILRKKGDFPIYREKFYDELEHNVDS